MYKDHTIKKQNIYIYVDLQSKKYEIKVRFFKGQRKTENKKNNNVHIVHYDYIYLIFLTNACKKIAKKCESINKNNIVFKR